MHGQPVSAATGIATLSEKEKQTLRLLLLGHDAKSMARHLNLSVHTINERLRDARRKLSVSSSKEAARLLRQSEATDPESRGDTPFGDAGPAPAPHLASQPDEAPRPPRRAIWAFGGVAMFSIVVAALTLTAPAEAPHPATATLHTAAAQAAAQETAAGTAARSFLTLIDASNWAGSYAATGDSFRAANTLDVWRSVSEKVRAPLGALVSRTLESEADVPAPPNGVRVVRFRADYTNRRGVLETVSLAREGGAWKVVGVYVE